MKDKDIKTWVKALRSGEYRQGQDHLCRTENGKEYHCCLGVMVDELIEDEWIYDYNDSSWTIHPDGDGLPSLLALEKIGLSLDTANILAGKNDAGQSFEEIADWIEDHREELINEG